MGCGACRCGISMALVRRLERPWRTRCSALLCSKCSAATAITAMAAAAPMRFQCFAAACQRPGADMTTRTAAATGAIISQGATSGASVVSMAVSRPRSAEPKSASRSSRASEVTMARPIPASDATAASSTSAVAASEAAASFASKFLAPR